MLGALATLGLSLPGKGLAENWVYYGESGKNSVFFVDKDSIRGTGNSYVIWTKSDHSKDVSEKSRETKTQYRIDCYNRTITLLYWIDYDASGSVINSNMIKSYQQETRPAVPGSIGESLLDTVCP